MALYYHGTAPLVYAKAMLFDRPMLETREHETLAPYATYASQSRGRRYPEMEATYRTAFQKDRDRVVHTNAFRRLEYKTQVFVNSQGDHYRTRLTHTLEVVQVAKSIARALGLNEDLTETIALAHDLGHPPFGHAGEHILNDLAKDAGDSAGFDHNKQSFRIVTKLEHRYPDFPGLNLCWETLEGIMKHEQAYDLPDSFWEPAAQPSLEAQLVDVADELTYNVHDIEDGLRSGHLRGEQLADVPLLVTMLETLNIKPTQLNQANASHLPRYHLIRELLGFIITDTITYTHRTLAGHTISTLSDVRNAPHKLVAPTPTLQHQLAELKEFLYANLYFHYTQIRMTHKAEHILSQLFHAYHKKPTMLPTSVQAAAQSRGLVRAIVDYLAGMTDRYANQDYAKLFNPDTITG